MDRVEVTGAIEACDLRLGKKILNKQAKGVKLDGNVVIMSKATDGDEVFD